MNFKQPLAPRSLEEKLVAGKNPGWVLAALELHLQKHDSIGFNRLVNACFRANFLEPLVQLIAKADKSDPPLYVLLLKYDERMRTQNVLMMIRLANVDSWLKECDEFAAKLPMTDSAATLHSIREERHRD